MLTLLAFMASTPSTAAWRAAICDVGRAALRDLPAINPNPEYDTYYGGVDADHHDVVDVCPELLRELPAGYPLATDAGRARARAHAPIVVDEDVEPDGPGVLFARQPYHVLGDTLELLALGGVLRGAENR